MICDSYDKLVLFKFVTKLAYSIRLKLLNKKLTCSTIIQDTCIILNLCIILNFGSKIYVIIIFFYQKRKTYELVNYIKKLTLMNKRQQLEIENLKENLELSEVIIAIII